MKKKIQNLLSGSGHAVTIGWRAQFCKSFSNISFIYFVKGKTLWPSWESTFKVDKLIFELFESDDDEKDDG